MGIPTLKIDTVSIDATRRLPQASFNIAPSKKQTVARAVTGRLFIQAQYEKYSIGIQGISQKTYPDLRTLYQEGNQVDLYSIVPRKETFSPSGSTNQFVTTRKIRTDDASANIVVQFPAGTPLVGASYSVLNLTNTGKVTTTFTPAVGSSTLLVYYYPIIQGYIQPMTATYDWVRDEETWDLTFEES